MDPVIDLSFELVRTALLERTLPKRPESGNHVLL